MPRVDEAFLEGFSRGLFALADAHQCDLLGGDTTQGPLTICITVFGDVPAGQALLRGGARPGDEIYVSGTLGDARLALEMLRGRAVLEGADFEAARSAMEQPQPRVALGQALRGIASSAIDVSDGLLGDLAHVLHSSGVGAQIDVDALPRSAVLGRQPNALQRECTLAGGDDYELLFTVAPQLAAQVPSAARQGGVQVTRIGHIESRAGLRLHDAGGRAVDNTFVSFDHFKP
jgi:thiamine-monophosphate kinase